MKLTVKQAHTEMPKVAILDREKGGNIVEKFCGANKIVCSILYGFASEFNVHTRHAGWQNACVLLRT